jgi:oligopeptide/dipeptide ABC transporter ATP-binding protein
VSAALLEVSGLTTVFDTDDGLVKAVQDVSFSVKRGQTLGLVGESGCGKSVTGLSLMQLVPGHGRVESGSILFHRDNDAPPVDIARLSPHGDAIRAIRGNDIAMVFQEPMTSLNPVYTVGNQIAEAVILHQKVGKKEAHNRAVEMLAKVGIPNPSQRVFEYPHQLSGGMRQRVMIAMALCCRPALVIADEPTTALDVTIQAQVLDLMKQLQHEFGMAILIITHDMGVVADMADEVVVMYAGRIVEQGSPDEIFYNPMHPYTKGLLSSIPVLGQRSRERLNQIPGTVPHLLALPKGCSFRPRCASRGKKCTEGPALRPCTPADGNGKGVCPHRVSCWLYE